MKNLFLRLVSRPKTEAPAESDARTALTALLVEAAHADGSYDSAEQLLITRIIAARFGLDEIAAVGLRTAGEAAQAEAVDLVRFTRAVKDAVPHLDRVSVIEAVWQVVYADGHREMHESALMRKLCGLLYVDDRDCGLARQRVAARLGFE